ncbi:MAG: winged helix-turn-helix domain-containing protein [Thermoanaerobaculia bacterium]
MDKIGVSKAFEALLQVLEEAKMDISKEAKESLEKMDFSKSRVLSEMGEKIGKFYQKIKDLKREWQEISFEELNLKLFEKREKLKKGLRTKQEDFFIPILGALVELGGSGKMQKVLERVYEKMKDRLNKYDLDPLPSDPKTIRWKNTAQWARNEMVKKGLLASKSPRGMWEISQKGREFLEKNK